MLVIVISVSLERMFGTKEHGRGGRDGQSYGEGVNMHVPSPGATVRTQSQEDCDEDGDNHMTDVTDATVHTQSQEKRYRDLDFDMPDAPPLQDVGDADDDLPDAPELEDVGDADDDFPDAPELDATSRTQINDPDGMDCTW